MQENSDKQLETLIGKVMKKATLESPTKDFTSNVMSQVVAIDKKTTITYRPLISKTTWFIILLGIVALVIYVLSLSEPNSSSWLNTNNFSFLSDNIFSKTLAEIRYSSATIYVVLTLTTMICIQIMLIKKYFSQRMEA